jgi:pimeloyl-ACP methyl ester carboxylesterase
MLARRLLWLLGLELFAYALLLHAAADGRLGWGFALATVIATHVALRCAVVPLGVLVAWRVDGASEERRLAPLPALTTFVNECAAVWRNYVLAPFDPWLAPPSARAAGVRPHCDLVLVHGILCNRVVWRRFEAELARRGIAAHAVNLAPILGSLDAMADTLAAELRARPRGRTLVVAHSMGGLVTRRLLQRHPDATIDGLVTIGTPHRGAAQAAFVPATAARSMRRGSHWLAALDRGPPPPPTLRRLAIRSVHDELVSPADSARWTGARELVLDGVGHVAMLEDARVIDAVVAELAALGADAGTARQGPETLR